MADHSRPPNLTRRQLLAASAASAVPFIAPLSLRAQTPAATPEPAPGGFGPQLYVSDTAVQFDEPFEIGVSGLDPLQEIEVSSAYVDAAGKEWTAEGSFVADPSGVLWLSTQAPIDGTFDVADPMALIWSAPPRTAAFYAPTIYGSEGVTITAQIGDRIIGTASVSRTILAGGGAPLLIDGPDLVAEFYEPASGPPVLAPAMVVLGGSEGGISTQLVAGLLASHGYAVLAVGYFNIGSLPGTLERIPLEYFGAAITFLREQSSVDADRLGVVGFSRGGELALLLGSFYPEFTAVVSYNGSGIVGPTPSIIPEDPAWTWQGEDLPFALTLEDDFAQIPVERTNGPILLISGDADELWPSTPLSQVAWDRLQRSDHAWPNQFLNFPGAGHGINAPYAPRTSEYRIGDATFGGDPWSDQIASVASWQAMLAMFAWRLKRGG